MKKITEAELRYIIDERLQDLWLELSDKLDINVSLEELPHNGGDIVEAIDTFTEKSINFFDDNGFVSDGAFYRANAFYTGGGIWICAKYIDDVHYVTIDNQECEYALNYFINDEEDNSIDGSVYPCYSLERTVELEEMNADELKLWKELHEELMNEMH